VREAQNVANSHAKACLQEKNDKPSQHQLERVNGHLTVLRIHTK
jgi:hypothetical protein